MSHRRLRILVADDNFVVARCLSFMLKKEGHDCRVVSDGEAALAALRERPAELLVLDLDMPRMDGFEVCRAVRADPALSSLHVLVLTAKGHPFRQSWRRCIDADGFMLKPLNPRALLEYVAETFGEADEALESDVAGAAGELGGDAHGGIEEPELVGAAGRG